MSTVRKVAENTFVVIMGQIIVTSLSVLISILFARYLGAENFGKYNLIYAYFTMFNFFGLSAIDTIVLREVSKDEKRLKELIDNAVILKLFFSIVGFILMNVVIFFMNWKGELRFLIFIATFGILFSFVDIYEIVFRTKFKMIYPSLILTIGKFLSAIVFILLIITKMPLVFFIVVNLLTGAVLFPSIGNTLLIVFWAKKYVNFNLNFRDITFDKNICRYILKESLPLILPAVFIALFSRIDQVLIHEMIGEKELGYYAACWRLIDPLFILPRSFMVPVAPLLAQYFVSSMEKFEKTYSLSLKYLLSFIIPVSAGTTVLARPIIELLYGTEYLPSCNILIILIWLPSFLYTGVVVNSALISSGTQKIITLFVFLQTTTNLILNILLIPKFGGIGSAISTLVANGFLGISLGYSFLITRRYVKKIFLVSSKPFLSSVLMAIILLLFPLPLFLAIPVGMIIYLTVLFILGGIDSDDVKYMREVIITKKI